MIHHSYRRTNAGIVLALDGHSNFEFVLRLRSSGKTALNFRKPGISFQIYRTVIVRNSHTYAQFQKSILRIRQFIFYIQFRPQWRLGADIHSTGVIRSHQFTLYIDYGIIIQYSYANRSILGTLLPFDMVFYQIQNFTGKGTRIRSNATGQTGFCADI